MKARLLVALMLFGLIQLGCSSQPDRNSLESELLQADKDWALAAEKGDIDKLSTFWSDSAVNFFPSAPPAYGKMEILELVRRNRSKPGFALSWQPAKAVVASSGDLGYTYGAFQMSFYISDTVKIKKAGNYVSIWSKTNGASWKCQVETTIISSE